MKPYIIRSMPHGRWQVVSRLDYRLLGFVERSGDWGFCLPGEPFTEYPYPTRTAASDALWRSTLRREI